MSEIKVLLSKKNKAFLKHNAEVEILEGTTSSSKSVVGGIKFCLKVLASDKKYHVLAADTASLAITRLVESDYGMKAVFGDSLQEWPNGHGAIKLPHFVLRRAGQEDKIVFVVGYDDSARWRTILGMQLGCAMIDEMNIADMDFLGQIFIRARYILGTLNPDDPEQDVYKQYINKCRPLPEWMDDIPEQMIEQLNEPEHPNWTWWYFTFEDNLGLSEERKEQLRNAYTPGTLEHQHYILGLRTKAKGRIFDNFVKNKHVVTKADVKKMVDGKQEKFILFSSGLDTSYSTNSDDTIAMSFIGITNKGRCIALDELVLTNKDNSNPFAPSDIVEKYEAFLYKNKAEWGMPFCGYIDNADQATIMEARKYNIKTNGIFKYQSCWKKMKIIDRIQMQKGWLSTGHFLVCDNCTNYIHELQVYSWDESRGKTIPEDRNDHCVNSFQYSFLPFVTKIGENFR